MHINQLDIDFFISTIGKENVLTEKDMRQKYASDHTEDYVFIPDVVLKPCETAQISRLLQYCNERLICVTARGAGTGLSGGSLAIQGGVALSMERFDKIVHIDEQNFQVTVEPGVITEVLQNAVKEKGLFYPPDPASRGWCFIGGNIAHNSGGPKAVKYGVVKDYVLNLEVVLANGEVIWTGANTLKNSTGYNLTHLMVGSEGTLGIISKIVLKLIPYPNYNILLLAPFYEASQACEAVAAIMKSGITPSGLEFMERAAIDWALRYVGDVNMEIEASVKAHLLIELDGNYLDQLYQDAEKIGTILQNYDVGEILFADSESQKNDLWKLRRNVGNAVKTNSTYKEEDTVVPRASLVTLLQGVKAVGAQYGFQSVCYGHAGDGNLHVNIIKGNLTELQWQHELPKAIREIFTLVKSLGGTISGEHGIGYVQKPYMDIMFSTTHLELMKSIKKVFDPNNILNPGKIFM